MLHSGTNSVLLLRIKTEKMFLEIKGRFKETEREKSLNSVNNEFKLANSSESTEFFIHNPEKPLFYENTTYSLTLASTDKNDLVDIEHCYPGMLSGISETDLPNGIRIISGSVNFRNNIGLSDFIIKLNGNNYGTLTLNVFPGKIDYEDDYLELMNEVNEEIYNLSFDFLRQTYLTMGLIDTTNQSSVEFVTILRMIMNDLERALKRIVEKPHHKVEKIAFYRKNRIKSKTIDKKWLIRHSNNVSCCNNGNYIIKKTRTIEKQTSYDTYENQYLKFLIKNIVKNIEFFEENYKKLYREQSEMVCREIDGLKTRLFSMMTTTFLSKVSDFQMRESNSLVFIMAEGYREFYKWSEVLKKGLKIQSDVFKLSQKDIAQLYEYWCYIKINKILRNHYNVISTDNVSIDNQGIFFTLKKGSNSRVKYINPRTDEVFYVSYNNRFDQVTTNQKPDNTLIIEKVNPNVKYHFIFDAKYKIDYADEKTDAYSKNRTPGPKEEDINTMHRYRDSIMYSSGKNEFSKLIFGAFVLFPYKDEEEYKEHKFYKSIEKVNIGAFPFLPSAYSLIEQFLINLIEESSISSYKKSIFNTGSNEFIKEVDFIKRNVIVGITKNEEQYKTNLNKEFYHIPLKRAKITEHDIEYVALSYSKTSQKRDRSSIEPGVKYYGKVKKIEVLKRREIVELPKKSDELYVKFTVEKWMQLPKIIEPIMGNVRVCAYTSEFLLKNAKIINELFIKTKEEFILWNELNRICDKYSIDLCRNPNDKNDLNIKSFLLNNLAVTIDNGELLLSKDNTVVMKNRMDDIIKSPINTIREIVKLDAI